jgi:hypothetical protein
MTAIDWHEIIAVATDRDEWVYGHSPDHDEVADCVLATRVPQACPTCDGSGWTSWQTPEMHGPQVWLCPDCPTVAKLLAIGAAVMGFDELPQSSDAYSDGWNDCLIALRAVEP